MPSGPPGAGMVRRTRRAAVSMTLMDWIDGLVT